MKTFFIDYESLTVEQRRDILGYILTNGLNHRKIDFIKADDINKALVVEAQSGDELKAFEAFLNANDIPKQITISANNKATIGTKVLGKLKLLGENVIAQKYYKDNTTGKRFVII